MCVWTCAYVYNCMCVHVCISVYMYVCMHTCICSCLPECICRCVYVFQCGCKHFQSGNPLRYLVTTPLKVHFDKHSAKPISQVKVSNCPQACAVFTARLSSGIHTSISLQVISIYKVDRNLAHHACVSASETNPLSSPPP